MNSLRNYNCVTSLEQIGEPLRLSYFKDGLKEVKTQERRLLIEGNDLN
jgi:hypothetical protein